jgi:hypothetical protein
MGEEPMTAMFRAVLIGVALLLAACATPAERAARCEGTDWRALGREDGAAGLPETRRSALFRSCREAGAPPDMAAYRAGHRAGLEAYCTEETGEEVGRSGARYYGVCPPELERAFLDGLRRGRAEYARNPPPKPRPYYHPGPYWWYPPGAWHDPWPHRWRYHPRGGLRFGYGFVIR